MLPEKDPRHETTRKYPHPTNLTFTSPRFAEEKESPADGPTGSVRSLNPTGVNETGHPRGEEVTARPEESMEFSMSDAYREWPWEEVGSHKIEGVGEIVVMRTAKSHYVVNHRFEKSDLRRIWPCANKAKVIEVLYRRFDAPRFTAFCWAFLGKVF